MIDSLTDAQRAEVRKYEGVYQLPEYRMGGARRACAVDNLSSFPLRDSYLDVGCGRGEMLAVARELEFTRVVGTEVVDYLARSDCVVQAPAWNLPFSDGEFSLVTLFDVIEHLLPEDTDATLRELRRVARCGVFITAANYSSRSLGTELHVNRRPYPVWDALFRDAFSGWDVFWLPRAHGTNSETWQFLNPRVTG